MKCRDLFLLLGAMLLFSNQAAVDAHAKTFEGKRAILDGDIELWTDEGQLNARIARVREARFNVYMPTVWQGRGTTWPSKTVPWDPVLSSVNKASFDPLRAMITKCHAAGIEVHPWFTVAFRWGKDYFPEFGLPDFAEGPHAAFDVHNPAFHNFIASLIVEVIANYDVDGLNLDFVRAIGLCTSERCRLEYKRLYGRNLLVDSIMFRFFPNSIPTLIEYQRNAVTALVANIVDSVRKVKPELFISVDVTPNLIDKSGFHVQGQSSIDWANRGMVDVLLEMDYQPTIAVGSTETTRTQLANNDALTKLISNMTMGADLPKGRRPFARSGSWLADTVSMIQARWPKTGVAVYFYKYLSDEQISALSGGPFNGQASPLGSSTSAVQLVK